MGEFPSGQRGQTVNLLRFASVVRIHLLPPNQNNPNFLLIGETFGFLVLCSYLNYRRSDLIIASAVFLLIILFSLPFPFLKFFFAFFCFKES